MYVYMYRYVCIYIYIYIYVYSRGICKGSTRLGARARFHDEGSHDAPIFPIAQSEHNWLRALARRIVRVTHGLISFDHCDRAVLVELRNLEL